MDNQTINRIGYMMEQALGSMTATLAAGFIAKGIDLPHSQYAVLRLIYTRQEPLTQSKIAEILKKDAAAVKRTLDILERKGLVRREAHNGRSKHVFCTGKALAMKETVTESANTTLHNIFGEFSDDELTVFTNILGKIALSKNV